MSSYTRMKKIFLRGLLWLYLFGFGYMALTLEPGFLDFDNLPDTNFTCVGKVIGGYYADLETNCQMFHVCTIGQLDEPMDIRFLCLNGTVFDQETRVCERVDEVDCSKSEQFYSLNLELYGNSQPTNLEENSETEQPLIIKSTLPPKTTTTTTAPTTKSTRPSYYSSSSASPVKSSTTQVLTHHFPVVNPNSADIRFNPEEINISLNPGAPPNIRTNPSFHSSNTGYSDKATGYSDNKVVVTTHHSVFDSHSDKRKETDSVTQVPSGLKTVANVHGYSNRPTPSDINYEFSFTDSSELEGYQTESYQFQKEFRPSQQYTGPLHIPRPQHYQTTTFRPITTHKSNNYQQQKAATTNRNFYIQSLKPPVANQQNHYVQHQTEKAPQRIQLELPLLPTLPPLAFSSPAPFTLQHHIDAKRYTKEHVSPPRIIISASASVSDASGRRLNYSLGTIGAQILDDPPNSYDEYKEADVPLDPFYRDVPRIKIPKRSKRSIDLQGPPVKEKSLSRKKRQSQFNLKHSDIIKNDQDAVNVLKFLFDWYRNEKTNPARITTPVSTALVPDEIFTINDAFSIKPEESEIEISTGSSHEDPLDIRVKTSDLFNKKSKYSILGDDKYAITQEEVKKVNKVQQNLSFSDTKISPKYSFLDDYVDDNYEPETYKSKFDLEDHFKDHERFKYNSFLDDKFPSDGKFPSDDKDFKSKLYHKEEDKNRSIPKDYVDDNIEPLYYKERYGDEEEKQKVIEQRSSSEDKFNKSKTEKEKRQDPHTDKKYNNEEESTSTEQAEGLEVGNETERIHEHIEESTEDQNKFEDVEQTTIQKELSDNPKTQVEQNRFLSQAHLESIDIEDMVEITTGKISTNHADDQFSKKIDPAVSSTKSVEIPSPIETTTPHLNHDEHIGSLLSITSAIDQTTTALEEVHKISETTTSSLQITNTIGTSTAVAQPSNEEHDGNGNFSDFSHLNIHSDEIHVVNNTESQHTTTSTNTQAVSDSTTTSTSDRSQYGTTEEEIKKKTDENRETNYIQESPVSFASSTVNQSEPEVNISISKAIKTSKSRTRTKGRGRRKFNDPEISFKNVLIEKLIEKPYRAKDDYDYLKTVSNVQSSTLTAEDSSESSIKISIPIFDSSSSTDQPSTTSSTIETTKSTRRRARTRHKLETTSARNIRRRRPSLNQIHANNAIPSVTSDHTTTESHTTHNGFNTHSTLTSSTNPEEFTKESHSEILENTSPAETILIRKIDEIELPHPSTVAPFVDTTQTTPTLALIEKENLGTTTYPPTNPTFSVEEPHLTDSLVSTSSSSSLDPFTQLDNIEEIYATSFVPTVKTHVTKKKELKVEKPEENSPTTYENVETTHDISEQTTTWTPLIHETTYEDKDIVQITTTNLPTQEEPVQTTFNDNYHSTFVDTTTIDHQSTSVDFKTTEVSPQETTKQFAEVQESQAPKSLYVTESIQKMVEEIETTTKSTAALVEKIPVHHYSKEHRHEDNEKEHQSKLITTTEAAQPVQDTTIEDTGITSNEIRDDSIKYEEKHNYRNHEDDKTIHHHHHETPQRKSESEIQNPQTKTDTTLEPETSTIINDLTTTTQEITTIAPHVKEVVATSPPSHHTEYSTTTQIVTQARTTEQKTTEQKTKGRQSRRRTFKPQRASYRHRFNTEESTSRPETRKETIEEEIISTIARTSKQLTTEPTRRIKKLRPHRTDIPLRKSASPTQSENIGESVLTTPLSRKTTVRKYYFFNCFNKETDKFYPDPRDCRLFHYCTQGYTKNQLLDLKFVCDYNTYFDDENLVCTKIKPKRCL